MNWIAKSIHCSRDKWLIESKVMVQVLDILMWQITWAYSIVLYSSLNWSRCFKSLILIFGRYLLLMWNILRSLLDIRIKIWIIGHASVDHLAWSILLLIQALSSFWSFKLKSIWGSRTSFFLIHQLIVGIQVWILMSILRRWWALIIIVHHDVTAWSLHLMLLPLRGVF